MSSVKNWGIYLNGLNYAGKNGKIITTIPIFSKDADPEFVKFNLAIATAKKEGNYVITRKNKKSDYVSSKSDDLAPFLNNEYVGVLTTKNNSIYILEFRKISSREYIDGEEYQPLEEVTRLHPFEEDIQKEYKDFNKALKASAKFQVIIKDKNGYDNEAKLTDALKKFIKYKYFGFFSKKSNFMEYLRFGYRRLSDEVEHPLIYGGNNAINDGPTLGDFLKIETKVAVAKTPSVSLNGGYVKKIKNQFTKILNKIEISYLGYIKRKSSKSPYEYDSKGGMLCLVESYPAMMINGFLNHEYNAIVSKDFIYEYQRIDIRQLIPNIELCDEVIEIGKSKGRWEGIPKETNTFNTLLEYGSIIIRTSDGFEDLNMIKDQTNVIKRLVAEEIEYFAVKSTVGNIHEFVRIDKRVRNSAVEEPLIYRK